MDSDDEDFEQKKEKVEQLANIMPVSQGAENTLTIPVKSKKTDYKLEETSSEEEQG